MSVVVPKTFSQRMENERGKPMRNPNSEEWYSRSVNEKSRDELAWAAPYDARFPQVRKQRKCFAYYVDFHRCQELMGKDHEPCQFFKNVYKDTCPKFWVNKWDELRADNRFPARFDR